MRPKIVKTQSDDGIWDIEDVEERAADATQWGLIGAKTYKGFPKTFKALPAGVYNITLDRNDDKPIFIRREIQTDDIFILESAITKDMIAEIAVFWGKKSYFQEMGFLHRRGYLLYGPQGTGKSSVVKQVMKDVVARGGLVFLCDNPKFFSQALVTLRQAEPNRPLVCVFEDIDAIIHKYGEDELLGVLDGTNMIDHVLNIATTNYPEKLDRRIVSRPRRFDRIIKVDVPSEQVRFEFFKNQIPKLNKKQIEELVQKTHKLSMAALSEVIISVYCLGNSLEDTIAILNRMEDSDPSSSEFGKSKAIGFSAVDSDDD